MSSRLTSIRLDHQPGLAEWGRKTRKEMIVAYRKKAMAEKLEAERILAAKDSDFLVQTFLGIHAQRNIQEVK